MANTNVIIEEIMLRWIKISDTLLLINTTISVHSKWPILIKSTQAVLINTNIR